MARPKDPNLERTWRQRLLRHSISGLSISVFCAREGVSRAAVEALGSNGQSPGRLLAASFGATPLCSAPTRSPSTRR